MPRIVYCMVLSLLVAANVKAQNIPNGITGPVTAIAQRAPDYLFFGDTPRNYSRVYLPARPYTDSALINMNSLAEDVLTATTYYGTFGRPVQQVLKQGSPAKKDNVTPVLYDQLGRQSTSYLPYTDNSSDGQFKYNAFGKDSAFYKSIFPDESINYTRTLYDASPLNIPVKSLAPGNSWGGAGIGIIYSNRSNIINDSVVLWTIPVSNENDVAAKTTFYQAGSLAVQEITDERGIKTVTYTNNLGQTVLTKTQVAATPGTAHIGWLCTYYVYDEMGQLRLVIPPKAVELINTTANNWSLSAIPAINTGFCYGYWYDSRGRLLMKRIPGKGKIYYAYDKMDRPVLSQDSALRAAGKWSFVKYDGQSRPEKTGIITLSGVTAAQVAAYAGADTSYPALTGTFTVYTQTWYDDYSFVTTGIPAGTLEATNINSTNFVTTYNTSPQYAQKLAQSKRIRGSVTGSSILVLGTATMLYTVNIYDSTGRAIQTKQTNFSGGTDVATVQYSFSGAVIRSHLKHEKLAPGAQNHTLLTKYSYDHAGRLLTLIKNIDSKGDKTIHQNSYNELSQLSSSSLGNGLETQAFTYNIGGWLLGINAGYVETNNSTNYFGEKLYYDFGFTQTQINGNIAGIKWRQKGDAIARAYGFGYDNANRISKADFTQQNTGATAWTSLKMDFGLSGMSYDANGNILTMRQRGVAINAIKTIDSLTYQYFTNTNRLQKVTDGISDAGPWGDFKDSTSTGDDYAYDANGNMVKDNNKHIHTAAGGNGITFNYLDKADTITLNGRGGIRYLYDAGGMLLQKITTSSKTATKTVTTYIAGFVYQKVLPAAGNAATVADTLQYALHEAGRIRNALKVNSTTGALYYAFEYDYFLKDHQGNIRSTITEGKDTLKYMATMESADSAIVRAQFANVYDPVNTVVTKPGAFDAVSSNQQVLMLDGNTKKTGAAILLKVMAGDKVQLGAYGWYNTAVQSPGSSPLNELVSLLAGALPGVGGATKFGTGTAGATAASPGISGFLSGRPYTSTRPKAYLNWILLDEQMNQVPGSGALQIPVVYAGAAKQALVPGLLTLPQSGYLYVYVSNESPQAVYFDDIVVQHYTGPLLSEDSYHPFGGTMAALSSKAFGKPTTRYKYNGGTELNDDLDLNYYETYFRNYDAQIGRFTGVDLLAEKYYSSTPYHFGHNNPVYFNDPSGLKSGRMEKGPDGNYHVGWVTEMAWNNVGFFNMSIDGGFDDGGGNGGGNYTNIMGLTSKQVLSWMGFGDRVGRMKGEVGIWQTSVTVGNFDDEKNVFESITASTKFTSFLSKINGVLNPVGIGASGLEYQLGKALSRFNRLDQIKSYNESWMLKNNPYLKTRTVNVEIPAISRHIEVPRNVLKGVSKGLQVFGVVTAGVSIANDINKLRSGEISGTHFAVNTVMNVVGFLGPIGAGVSILYGLTEDFWFENNSK